MWLSRRSQVYRVLFVWGVLVHQSVESFPISVNSNYRHSSVVVRWGKNRIQRVGRAAEDIEPAPSFIKNEKEEKEELIIPDMSLDEILSPSQNCDVTQMGPTALAYIGDVVFELFVRSKMVWPSRRTADLQIQVTSIVRAEYQAKLLKKLSETFSLTKTEESVISRGRNSGAAKGNRRKTKDYNDATALEALIGFVYITDKTRCRELMNWMYAYLESTPAGES